MNARIITVAFSAVALFPPVAVSLTADGTSVARTVTMRAAVPMGSVVSPGDRMWFDLQVSSDASLVVFDIDSRGRVHLLHPVGDPEMTSARGVHRLPGDESDLVVDGERGVEFVFAVAVDDPSWIDRDALASLAASDLAGGEPYRAEGDPFLAANTIAGDVIRDVARSGASFAYTYFYVSERVDHPCYLCGPCDEAGSAEACADYRVEHDFDRRSPLAYPLRRGYVLSETAATGTDTGTDAGLSPIVIPSDENDVVVNFYPYGSQVRYVDPNLAAIYSDAWWYDPYYWYYPGWYPYYPGFSVSIGFGWGWGWGWGCWGGYYCSGWYAPPCGGYAPYYPSYPGEAPDKYKNQYASSGGAKSGLARNRTFAAQKDGEMRIASTGVKPSVKRPAAMRSPNSRVVGRKEMMARTGYTRATGKSRPTFTTRDVVRSTVTRGKSGAIPTKTKSTGPRMRPNDRRSSSGGAVRSKGVAPSRGSSKAMQPRASSTARSHSVSAPRGGSFRPSARGKGR